MEVLIASSPVDANISCWDLHTGNKLLNYHSCASPPHGLVCIGHRFLASSQIRDSSSGGLIFYWSWNKPQVGVKSFPAEPIKPLLCNHEGTYIIGGGVSGHIYVWEIATGRLLRRWHGHYRAVTCLVLSDDESILISGADDGGVRVWSLFLIFDDLQREEAKHLYLHNFSEHTLRVTDIVIGYGGCSANIITASEDRTCKVWSLSMGKLLRNIVFPSIIDSIALDPLEHVFYAGGRDGKIYIAALNAESTSISNYGMHIIGSLFDHSKAVTCLAFGMDGILLVSGSEDGMIRVWDTKTRNIVRMFKHAKGHVNNIVIRRSICSNHLSSQTSISRRHGLMLPPPLEKYANPMDEHLDLNAVIASRETCNNPLDDSFPSAHEMQNQIKELQQRGSSAVSEMEMERLKFDCRKSLQIIEHWKKMFENLHQFCIDELLDGDQRRGCKGNSS